MTPLSTRRTYSGTRIVPCDFTPRRSAATIESAKTLAISGSRPTAAMMSVITLRNRSTG